MKKRLFYIALITSSIFILSCSNKQNTQPTSNNTSTQASPKIQTQQPTPTVINDNPTPTPGVLADSTVNPTYILSWDDPDTDTDAKDVIIPVNGDAGSGICTPEIEFADHTKVSPKQDYKFLMINGQLIPGAGVVTKNSIYYVPVKALISNSTTLKWDDKKKVLTQIADNEVTSSTTVKINNEYYVPLGFLSFYNFFKATYTTAPFDTFPIITIDTDITEAASDKDIQSIKQKLSSMLDQVKKKYSKDSYNDYNFVKKELQKLKYAGDISRYWMLQDDILRTYLVDSKTKKIFLFRGNGYSYGLEALSVESFYLMNFTS